jgi:IclR family pca regulon transcriptional regulator
MSDVLMREALADRDFVRSLQRGLAAIGQLGRPGAGQTLDELADAIGVPRATMHRVLLTLQRLGYVRTERQRYSLTPKVLAIGLSYRSSLALADVAQPHLQGLLERTGEFCSVSVLENQHAVCVARAAPERIMTVAMSVGTRLPAYATCVGRVLLAELEPKALDRYLAAAELRPLTEATLASPEALRVELDRVRRQRWALVDQELEPGLRSAAAPIRDAGGHVVAAANIGTHAPRVTLDAFRKRLLPPLRGAAEQIEHDLAIARP